MKKKPTLKALVKKLDKAFSEYIRQRDADEGGTVRCVTCPKLMFWKDADCGHWIKRQHRSVRWDERNAGPQCQRCNHFLGGAQDEFAKHIVAQYGLRAMDELLSEKHVVRKYSREDIEKLIAFYSMRPREIDGPAIQQVA